MELVYEDATELKRLPQKSFFLDAISLQDGVGAVDDMYTNSLKALAILGCACVGHTGTREDAAEEGFYVTLSSEDAVRDFLDLRGSVQAPKFIAADSDNNFVKTCIDTIKKTYEYDFGQYFYFVLMQSNESGDIVDMKTKQLPKHPNVILGKDTESVTQSMMMLMPYLKKMQPADNKIVPALAASALYARSKCPGGSG